MSSPIETRSCPNLPALLRAAAERFGPEIALRRAFAPAEDSFTYVELHARATAGARRLRAADLAAGDRVLIVAPGSPQWVIAFFALLEAGLVPVPVSLRLSSAVVAELVRIASPAAAVVDDDGVGTGSPDSSLPEGFDGLRVPLGELCALPSQEGAQAARGNGTAPPARRDDLALLAFTSGTTGTPRCVELTHGNLLSNLESLLAVRHAAPGDALISIMSPSELFELTVGLLAALACGARVVYAGPLPPNRLLRAMREEHISHALLVPAFLQLLIEEVLDELAHAGLLDRRGTLPELARRLRDEPDPELRRRWQAAIRGQIGERMSHIAVGGAALDPVWAELAAELGLAVDLGYGLAEASPVVCLGPVDAARRGSVGRPLPGVEVRVSPGGEILVRGPNVMRGYRCDLEATAAALAGGWLHTGDRGRVDAAGFVSIEGRIKETMVTSSGQTVHPEEIEPFYASTLFREYCVAPLRDAAGNDSPTLFLVPLSPEVSAGELDDAFKSLRAAAPPRARVDRWVALEDPLPRTPLGKIRRRYLADLWQARKATHDE